MSEVDRGRAMAASIVRVIREHGLAPEGIDLVSRAHALAMQSRIELLDDDHHPSYLHPGRSVLMLLQDVGPLPAEILATAAVHDSEDDDLWVSWDAVRETLGDAVADMVESLPLPGEERLTERLVGLDEGACLAALAERLDHLRHAHLARIERGGGRSTRRRERRGSPLPNVHTRGSPPAIGTGTGP
ncbi:MAG TPA: hypothetical protein EYQ27_12110 [Gemmatimonadetes bacterium]|nr:hypothetical protein [Gemmatimonadota bacterium]